MSATPASGSGRPAPVGDELERLASLLHEERVLRFPYFTAATAFDLGLAICTQHSKMASSALRNPILISISTFTGAVLFQCVAGGDPPDAADLTTWVAAKCNTVRRFGHSSAFIEHRLRATGGRPEDMGLVWPEYAACGGGFPIYLTNAPAAPIGAIVVTGLRHEEDHDIIIQTLSEFIPGLARPQPRSTYGPPPVLSPAPHIGSAPQPLSTTSLYDTSRDASQEREDRMYEPRSADSQSDFRSDSSAVAGDEEDEGDVPEGARWF